MIFFLSFLFFSPLNYPSQHKNIKFEKCYCLRVKLLFIKHIYKKSTLGILCVVCRNTSKTMKCSLLTFYKQHMQDFAKTSLTLVLSLSGFRSSRKWLRRRLERNHSQVSSSANLFRILGAFCRGKTLTKYLCFLEKVWTITNVRDICCGVQNSPFS